MKIESIPILLTTLYFFSVNATAQENGTGFSSISSEMRIIPSDYEYRGSTILDNWGDTLKINYGESAYWASSYHCMGAMYYLISNPPLPWFIKLRPTLSDDSLYIDLSIDEEAPDYTLDIKVSYNFFLSPTSTNPICSYHKNFTLIIGDGFDENKFLWETITTDPTPPRQGRPYPKKGYRGMQFSSIGNIYTHTYSKIYSFTPSGIRKVIFDITSENFEKKISSALHLGYNDIIHFVTEEAGSEYLYSITENGNIKYKTKFGYLYDYGGSMAIDFRGNIYLLEEPNVGKIIIRCLTNNHQQKWIRGGFTDDLVTLRVVNDELIYAFTKDSKVEALSIENNGSTIWTRTFSSWSEMVWPSAFDKYGNIYINKFTGYYLGPDSIISLSRNDGAIRWIKEKNRIIGYLYETVPRLGTTLIGKDDVIYISDYLHSPPQIMNTNVNGNNNWIMDLSIPLNLLNITDDGSLLGYSRGMLISRNNDGTRKWNYLYDIEESEKIRDLVVGSDGTIFINFDNGSIVAFQGNGYPLAKSPWPAGGGPDQRNSNSILLNPPIPVHIYPSNKAEGILKNANLSWESINNTIDYRLQVLKTNNNTLVVDISNLASSTYPTSELEYNTNYQWRLQASNYLSSSGWSEFWEFTTLTTPDEPTLIQPEQFAQNVNIPVIFVWNNQSWVDSFFVNISTDSQFYSIECDTVLIKKNNLILSALDTNTTYYWQVSASNRAGRSNWSKIRSFKTTNDLTAVESKAEKIPDEFNLAQNYPNPFNPETTIGFDVKESTTVNMTIYDLRGRYIKTLVNAKYLAGSHHVNFNANNLPSGIYFYSIEMANYRTVKKMVLVR